MHLNRNELRVFPSEALREFLTFVYDWIIAS